MVRISTETKYKLIQAVEKSETQYTNSTHTYYLDKIYTSFPEPETEVYDVIRVTRRANKDLGRLVEVEEVGYINFYVDREFHRTEFSDKAETGDTISRHWKDSYLQSDDGKLTSHAVSLHYLKKERKQKNGKGNFQNHHKIRNIPDHDGIANRRH